MAERTKVGVVGNGFVGGAVAFGFAPKHDVYLYDVDESRRTHTLEEVVENCPYIFVCVPTPSNDRGEFNLSYITQALNTIQIISSNLAITRTVVIKSTVPPGTCDHYSNSGFLPNLDIVYNPEFLTERTAKLDFINPTRIVLGGDPHDTTYVQVLYQTIFHHCPIIKTDFKSAELVKVMTNNFFATKVSFMNEMKRIADGVGANWQDVVEGFVADNRVAQSHIDVPGPDGEYGFGGKCLPKDLTGMIQFARNKAGVEPIVLEAVARRNGVTRHNNEYEHLPLVGAEEFFLSEKDKS